MFVRMFAIVMAALVLAGPATANPADPVDFTGSVVTYQPKVARALAAAHRYWHVTIPVVAQTYDDPDPSHIAAAAVGGPIFLDRDWLRLYRGRDRYPFLRVVIRHEYGHALGHAHTATGVMAPYTDLPPVHRGRYVIDGLTPAS